MLSKVFKILFVFIVLLAPVSAICGVDEFVNITEPYDDKFFTYSANLKVYLDPTNPAAASTNQLYCNVSGANNFFKQVNATQLNGAGVYGQIFYSSNFYVDYDGNYTADCYMIDMLNTNYCSDQVNFTVDRSQYAEQKGLISAAVLIFIILFAALFTGIGLMINSAPMKIFMYMFGITAGIVGLNFSQVALREWVKVPSQTGIIMTFANGANWYYYFILAILLLMIIIYALHNYLNDKEDDDISFMN